MKKINRLHRMFISGLICMSLNIPGFMFGSIFTQPRAYTKTCFNSIKNGTRSVFNAVSSFATKQTPRVKNVFDAAHKSVGAPVWNFAKRFATKKVALRSGIAGIAGLVFYLGYKKYKKAPVNSNVTSAYQKPEAAAQAEAAAAEAATQAEAAAAAQAEATAAEAQQLAAAAEAATQAEAAAKAQQSATVAKAQQLAAAGTEQLAEAAAKAQTKSVKSCAIQTQEDKARDCETAAREQLKELFEATSLQEIRNARTASHALDCFYRSPFRKNLSQSLNILKRCGQYKWCNNVQRNIQVASKAYETANAAAIQWGFTGLKTKEGAAAYKAMQANLTTCQECIRNALSLLTQA